MKTLLLTATLTLFAAVTAVEDFGGIAKNFQIGDTTPTTDELVLTTFTQTTPF